MIGDWGSFRDCSLGQTGGNAICGYSHRVPVKCEVAPRDVGAPKRNRGEPIVQISRHRGLEVGGQSQTGSEV